MRGRAAIPLVLATLLVLGVPATAQAIIPVTTTVDEQDASCSDGDCSLRDAVIIAGRSGDVVQVPAGTYTLSIGELEVGNATIGGAGAGLTTIRAGAEARAIQVISSATIAGVTITGGSDGFSGGGIQVGFGQVPLTLHLNHSTIVDNEAFGSSGFGGGIHVSGQATLVMTDSTVAGNRVSEGDGSAVGGGIYVDTGGRAELRNSTVSGNTAAGMFSDGLGGGIGLNDASTLVLENVTVASNSAVSGGGIAEHLDFSSPTPPTMTISDTIVAGNAGPECSGAMVHSGDYNLADDATCAFTATGDKQTVNPLLGPLQVNTGPGRTPTHSLSEGSPAINAGDPTTCKPTDQRGVARPAGACDIGAFEYVPPPPPPPPPPSPPEQEQLPPPKIRKTVNVSPKSGTIRIKLKGQKKFTKLTEGAQIPVGSTIDARKGRVTLTAAANNKGKTATADFYEGLFKVGQTKGKKPFTVLKLIEKLSCGKRGKASAAAKKGKRKRRLWGSGKGRFRTKGRYSSATVRGTIWLTQDHCDRTWVKVTKGKVSVRDFVKKKTILVRKGKDYIARAKKR